MKKLTILLFTVTVYVQQVQAQVYSEWITASKNPTLKMRHKTAKNASGYNFLVIEFISSTRCKFNVTATLCNKTPALGAGRLPPSGRWHWSDESEFSVLFDLAKEYTRKILCDLPRHSPPTPSGLYADSIAAKWVNIEDAVELLKSPA